MNHRLLAAAIVLQFCCAAAWCADALRFRGADYVSLKDLTGEGFLNGTTELTHWGRHIVIALPDRDLIVENGGDRIRDRDGMVHHFERPILVDGEEWFVPVEPCAPLFGYEIVTTDPLVLAADDKRLELGRRDPFGDYPFARVERLRPEWRAARLTRSLEVSARRGRYARSVALPGDTVLVVRRTVWLDGVPWLVVTIDDEMLESFLVEADRLAASSTGIDVEATRIARLFAAARALAKNERAIRHGPRDRLADSVALTSDLCWSLRPCESRLYDMVAERAAAGRTASVTQFVTGRWMQQYPFALDDLLRREDRGDYHQTWGLHSWDHPKSGNFMNAWYPASLRGDTLAQEKLMLEWGIAPGIAYRFPGLIHDKTRLETIIDLALVPVDCESWVSGMRTNRPPTRIDARGGSILLVHGNGNEPGGVERFADWSVANPEFDFAPLALFLDPESAMRDAEAEAVLVVD